ncbi:MAG: hypothetical protein ACR2GX_04750 [Candidatus Dormibacteria bacterium]
MSGEDSKAETSTSISTEVESEAPRWYLVVSDDNVFADVADKRPGRRFVHLNSEGHLSTSWPYLVAGRSPTLAFLHPIFGYPTWPFSIYEVEPGSNATVEHRGDKEWMRSAEWTVIRKLDPREALGPNAEHVVALFDQIRQTTALTQEETAAKLKAFAVGIGRETRVYGGPLGDRILALLDEVTYEGEEQRGLTDEMAIARGVMETLAGAPAPSQDLDLLDLAAEWAVVFGDSSKSAVRLIGEMMAAGVQPYVDGSDAVGYTWMVGRHPKPGPTADAPTADPAPLALTDFGKSDNVSDAEMEFLAAIETRMAKRLVGHEENIEAFAKKLRQNDSVSVSPSSQ